jgi:HlyD family secretion protein
VHPAVKWLHAVCNWVLGAAVLGGAAWGLSYSLLGPATTPLTATVTRACFSLVVTERGEVESFQTTQVCCEVEGCQNRIATLLPEGTVVQPGQVVLTFGADRLTRLLECQELKLLAAAKQARAARYERDVETIRSDGDLDRRQTNSLIADLEARKYTDGDYKVSLEADRGDIELARRDLQEKFDHLNDRRKLYRQGFETLEHLRAEEFQYLQKAASLQQMETRLSVMDRYTRLRCETQLRAAAFEAKRDLERARNRGALAVSRAQTEYETATRVALLEQETLDRLHQQLERCTVKAPRQGMIVYARLPFGQGPIAPGATVCFQQPLFSLPDLTRMQVQTRIHESRIGRVKVGQRAIIRLEADPDSPLRGTVTRIGALADFRGPREDGGVKTYTTIVQIDDLPADAGLSPGMTAEVTIQVEKIPNALVIPVQALAESESGPIVYVIGRDGAARCRQIDVAENNEEWVRIKSGLEAGETVALDARARLAAGSGTPAGP